MQFFADQFFGFRNEGISLGCKLTRERPFVQFWQLHEDLSDHSQTLPKYRGRHPHQKSREKIDNIYGHLARIAI